MQRANLTGLTDDEIMAELDRERVATQQPKGTARRVAWHATFLCVVTLVGMIVLALVNRNTLPMPWLYPALVPFFSYLPVVFFRVAMEQQQMEDQIRELRNRVDELERVAALTRSAAS